MNSIRILSTFNKFLAHPSSRALHNGKAPFHKLNLHQEEEQQPTFNLSKPIEKQFSTKPPEGSPQWLRHLFKSCREENNNPEPKKSRSYISKRMFTDNSDEEKRCGKKKAQCKPQCPKPEPKGKCPDNCPTIENECARCPPKPPCATKCQPKCDIPKKKKCPDPEPKCERKCPQPKKIQQPKCPKPGEATKEVCPPRPKDCKQKCPASNKCEKKKPAKKSSLCSGETSKETCPPKPKDCKQKCPAPNKCEKMKPKKASGSKVSVNCKKRPKCPSKKKEKSACPKTDSCAEKLKECDKPDPKDSGCKKFAQVDECDGAKDGTEIDIPDIFEKMKVLCTDNLKELEACFGDCYKNKEYYMYNKYSYYDIVAHLTDQRLPVPSNKPPGPPKDAMCLPKQKTEGADEDQIILDC